ncbi:MAG: copper resistance protein CopC [Bdellovibrionota bacterium]
MNFRFSLLFIMALWPLITLAHIDLITATPGKNEVIEKPIQVITLKLSGKAEAKFSKIEVIEVATKERIDSGQVDADLQKNTLSTSLKIPLKTGKYHVKWKVVSVDTHKAHGEYDFTYAPKDTKKDAPQNAKEDTKE